MQYAGFDKLMTIFSLSLVEQQVSTGLCFHKNPGFRIFTYNSYLWRFGNNWENIRQERKCSFHYVVKYPIKVLHLFFKKTSWLGCFKSSQNMQDPTHKSDSLILHLFQLKDTSKCSHFSILCATLLHSIDTVYFQLLPHIFCNRDVVSRHPKNHRHLADLNKWVTVGPNNLSGAFFHMTFLSSNSHWCWG